MKLQRILDHILLGVGVFSPLVGVALFGWNIHEVVFLYAAEAGVITLYTVAQHWLHSRRIFTQDDKEWHTGLSVLRIGVSGILVVLAFAVLIDARVGYRSTLFDHLPILFGYAWATLIPLISIGAHYGKRLRILLMTSNAKDYQPAPMWVWVIQIPLPLFMCTYILATKDYELLIGLLAIVVILKGVMEYIHTKQRTAVANMHTTNPLELHSSIHSIRGIMSNAGVYILVLIGFAAVNPFTQDPRFSTVQNVLIFFGLVCVAIPFLYRPRIVLRLNVGSDSIEMYQSGLRPVHRIILLANITRVQAKRNDHKKIHSYIFTIKNEKPWKCSMDSFNPTEWKTWLTQVKAAGVDLQGL